MCLVDGTVNARPLTTLKDDADDLETVIPLHYLLVSVVQLQPLKPSVS